MLSWYMRWKSPTCHYANGGLQVLHVEFTRLHTHTHTHTHTRFALLCFVWEPVFLPLPPQTEWQEFHISTTVTLK